MKVSSSLPYKVKYILEVHTVHKMWPLKWARHHNVSQIALIEESVKKQSCDLERRPEISVSFIDCKSRSNTRRSKDQNFKNRLSLYDLFYFPLISLLSRKSSLWFEQGFFCCCCVVVYVCFFDCELIRQVCLHTGH